MIAESAELTGPRRKARHIRVRVTMGRKDAQRNAACTERTGQGKAVPISATRHEDARPKLHVECGKRNQQGYTEGQGRQGKVGESKRRQETETQDGFKGELVKKHDR